MFEINGQHNTIKVMLPPGNIDEATLSQLKIIANFEPFTGSKIAVMPDCHAGKGCCVGLTMTNFKVVVPNLVGVDIGCGMCVVPLPEAIKSPKDFERFDKALRIAVPSGFNIHPEPVAELDAMETKNAFEALALKVEADIAKVFCSIGTLGGGNHMVEVDQSGNGDQFLLIHSGSRNLGLRVCNYHQNIAKVNCQARGFNIPGGLEFLEGSQADEYLADMLVAQRYARLNRETMASQLFQKFFGTSDISAGYHCTHNYVADGFIRKGACSAQNGEKVVIPLNMRDGVILGRGKGNEEWNFSAPHGAGRLYSRSQAKRHLDLKDFQNSMKEVWTSSVSKETLDESPMAYKPQKLILQAIAETIAVDEVCKPVYNFKAA
jgi:tRNA-splicing ligase RtcB (3'-phosphate/5'-hydroxy nucleic acid ligase)